MIAEHDGQPCHALPSNQADFDLLAVGLNSDDGREAALREIGRLNSSVGLFEALPHAELHGFEVRF
jgi:hypothetical protein